MKQITTEEMRYKVPKVKNRFIAAHIKFIAVCAVIAAIAVILFASYLYITEIRKLEPKRAFVFVCDVQNIDECNKIAAKFSNTVEIYFAKYDEQFTSSKENSFNFSAVTNTLGDYEPEANTAVIIFNSNRKSSYYYSYEYFGLTESPLTAEQIEKIVREMITR